MNDKKVCPMMSGPPSLGEVNCAKKECAWWYEYTKGDGECAIATLAFAANEWGNKA